MGETAISSSTHETTPTNVSGVHALYEHLLHTDDSSHVAIDVAVQRGMTSRHVALAAERACKKYLRGASEGAFQLHYVMNTVLPRRETFLNIATYSSGGVRKFDTKDILRVEAAETAQRERISQFFEAAMEQKCFIFAALFARDYSLSSRDLSSARAAALVHFNATLHKAGVEERAEVNRMFDAFLLEFKGLDDEPGSDIHFPAETHSLLPPSGSVADTTEDDDSTFDPNDDECFNAFADVEVAVSGHSGSIAEEEGAESSGN